MQIHLIALPQVLDASLGLSLSIFQTANRLLEAQGALPAFHVTATAMDAGDMFIGTGLTVRIPHAVHRNLKRQFKNPWFDEPEFAQGETYGVRADFWSKRIAAPMVGGMVYSTVLTLAVIPATYALVKQWRMGRGLEG